MLRLTTLLVAVLCAGRVAVAGDELTVTATVPSPRSVSAPVAAPVTIHFDRPIDAKTVNAASFRVFGKWSGTHFGSFAVSGDGLSVALEMAEPFSAGEQVLVILSHDLAGTDGSLLRSAGYSFQFWTRVRETVWTFDETQTLSTNAGPESSRPYGGIGSDLNNDGWLDITVVNEDTSDLRTFLNNGAGDGMFASEFLQPPAPVNDRASPSEPADFDNDGNTDIVVANIDTNSVSVLLGNGDGTFAPHQEISVGSAPRGVAVLDVDGDGDMDFVNTNSGSGNLSLLVNDGNGVFAAPSYFEGGGTGEWGLASGDFNEDGIIDLAVGARSSQQLIINTCDGNGSFTASTPHPIGGAVWMLVVGDVDGDGHEDVVSANSNQNNGAVVRGDGALGFVGPFTYATDPFPLATDLGDLDGDGDLDWSVSCFQGDWLNFQNTGNGSFVFAGEFNAPANASCTVLMDVDNDGDLDQALIDEIDDVVIIQQNDGIANPADTNGDGVVDVQDLTAVILAWGPCPAAGPCAADLNGDGKVDVVDLTAVVLGWG